MNVSRAERNLVNPYNPEVRSAGDMIWEQAALNNLAILGAEKRITPDGKVQWRDQQTEEWITLGKVQTQLPPSKFAY